MHRPDSSHARPAGCRSEEHTSELQSRLHLVCRLLLEKKKTTYASHTNTPANSDSTTPYRSYPATGSRTSCPQPSHAAHPHIFERSHKPHTSTSRHAVL